jgi:hypothetical protein
LASATKAGLGPTLLAAEIAEQSCCVGDSSMEFTGWA